MKKAFTLPFVLMSPAEPEPTSVVGGGTGQGGTDPLATPMPFTAWQSSNYWQTYDQYGNDDGNADWEEFCMWWVDNEFTIDQWTALGPDYTASNFPGNN